MPTVIKKPAARGRAQTEKPATVPAASLTPVRRTPPPGLSAAEFLKRLPPPSGKFDAAGMERIIASRADR